MHKKLRLWATLEGATALVLLFVSAAFSFVLFIGFARSPWQVPLYGALAIGFESTKALLWIAGIVKEKRYFQVLALCFAVLSLGASATTLIGEAQDTAKSAGRSEGLIESLERSILASEKSRDSYSQEYKDYRAVVEAFNEQIAADRSSLSSLLSSETSSITTRPASASNFTSLASVLSSSPGEADRLAGWLRLVYIALVVLGIEVGGFALSSAALRQMRADLKEEAPSRNYVGAHLVLARDSKETRTHCGRIFSATALISNVAPGALCPQCAKGIAP